MEGNKKPELGNYEVDRDKGLQARKREDAEMLEFLPHHCYH